MELPWLIQPGDSGSWVLDAGNGMLMGVLVAGCPELQEAYFIPAHEIFDDIRQHYPDRYPDMPVSLPNCHLLPRTSQIDLKRHIDEYGRIVKSCLNSPQGLEELDNHITKWVDQSETFVDVSSSLYNLRDERSEWKSALSVLKYSNLDKQQNDGFDNSMKHNLRTVFQQSPLRCYNFLNEIFVSGQDLQHIASMKRFWRCLMLGCVSYTSNDRDLSFDTASDYRSAIIRELRLMNITSRDHSGFQSPWEKDSIAKSHWKYSFRHTDSFADHVSEHAIFPWAEHASKHIFPNPSLNKGDWKYLSRTDHLFRIIYSHRTGLPPWDRLTATEVLHTLRGDLQDLNTLLKRGVEISLPETKMPDSQFVSQRLRSDGDIMLFAVKLTEKNNRFLVVLPPPSVGPSKSIQPWPSARDYPAYARSNRHIAFSAWRLPFMLTDKSTPEEECLELLLSTQLNIDIGALKQRWKLDLRDEHSRFYLKEYNKYVDVVIYEGHVEDQSFVSPKMIHGPTGWMMQMMDEASARKHLSPPFSAILYPPIPDEQNIN
ncbi:hypothetical protein NXS19_008368 [Fusarium pseudograminearum]|nr:hypothetical protein NXS19_008368 [Fusarium pseudograminearum]